MNSFLRFTAAPMVLALAGAAPAAHANSAASASLSFSVLGGPGFTWLTTPVSTGDSSAISTPFAGFVEAAGVFGPTYGPAVVSDNLGLGVGVPASTASATSFARSWFSLDAGASVIFQGALLMAMTGTNPALPATFNTSDFYSFASGLLAVGADEALRELGGPVRTGMVGSYSLNDFGMLSLTVTNSTSTLLTTFLDSGVTVYSASVVPEPGTYALLLAGLGAIAFIARRRSGR